MTAQVGELDEEEHLVQLGGAAHTIISKALGHVEQQLPELRLVVGDIHADDTTEGSMTGERKRPPVRAHPHLASSAGGLAPVTVGDRIVDDEVMGRAVPTADEVAEPQARALGIVAEVQVERFLRAWIHPEHQARRRPSSASKARIWSA